MNKQDYIDGAESALLHTYNRFPLVIDHGDGVYLYDTDGKEYLDFAAGIAVQAFGYNNKEYNDALKAQIDKVMHTSNLYYNVPIMNAAKRLLKASRMNRVFFTNSGTEAIVGGIAFLENSISGIQISVAVETTNFTSFVSLLILQA